MSFEPSPKQVLLLWRMMFLGEEPMQSKTKPGISKKERDELFQAGFIKPDKRGRATYLQLKDYAWDWAVKNLDAKISDRTPAAGPVLQKVLTLLKNYMQTGNVSLYEFVHAKPRENKDESDSITCSPPGAVPETPASAACTPAELELKIRNAYFQASGGEARKQIRLRQLRNNLRDLPRSVLDDTLCRMKSDHKIILYPLDDPLEITPADQEAALTIAGRNNHIIILEG